MADIHVRLTKRHSEYREVFQKFYDDVKNSPATTLVAILGDMCHNKSDLSPECVQMVSEFLFTLASLRETILVPGNHDATLSNKTRLDSLSPIVEALNHSRLHYLKESKLYGIGNILLNNMCIFDDPEKYMKGYDIPEVYRNQYSHIIALFHGAVDGSVTDTGFRMNNPAIMPLLFDWHHIALLGDIHKRQNIQEAIPEEHKPCIHFCGSLLQQNHGESLHGHGYTLWDLKDYSYKHVEVPNDYGHFTLELNGGQILTNLDDLPKKTYLRIKCLDTIPSEVKATEAKLSLLTEIVETARIRIESETDKQAKKERVCKDVKLAEIADVDYQNKLITEFLEVKENLRDKSKVDKILLINREVNTEIKKDEFARNIKWIPIKFEWSNMFVYGENNVIDFTQMRGTYGVFGPNTCGKSSIFSALCFCMFDKWDRGYKSIVARNVSTQGFHCKFEFEISGIRYFIEKTGETTKGGNVRVEVNFWRIVDGVVQDLTDVMRRKTNDVIRDYVGTFEDFIVTTLSVQTVTKNTISFIDLGNTERKDLLVQFMGLNVFDKLYDAAYAKGKELTIELKPHKDKNYIKDLDDTEATLKYTQLAIGECQHVAEDVSRQVKEVNDNIVIETTKLIKLDNEVPTDILFLEKKRLSSIAETEKLIKQIGIDKPKLEIYRKKMLELNEQLSEIIAVDLVKEHKKYNEICKQLNDETRKYELKKVEIKNKLDKLKKLEEYKYDPNCVFCVENVFVKDARQTKSVLKTDQEEMNIAFASITKLKEQQKECDWVDAAYQHYTKLLNDHSKAKDDFTTLNTKILLTEKDVEKGTQSLLETERKIELYHRNQIALENNQKINLIILTYKNTLNKLESTFNSNNKKLLELVGKEQVLKGTVQTVTETIQKMIDTEEKRELYEYYCRAVGRNGIPYVVICNTIPEITREINAILTQTTDFTVDIEYDEKNITPYVNYETKGRWVVESLSGFERVITSIAIRVALCNISNLPRNNFLIVDEGWGALDAHNLSSVPVLLSVLKSHFDFIIIISHLNVLRDYTDNQIEIKQIGNFSKVTF